MAEDEVDVEYIINQSTGMTHRALILNGVRFTVEECNVDQIGNKEVADTPTDTYCQHCFNNDR